MKKTSILVLLACVLVGCGGGGGGGSSSTPADTTFMSFPAGYFSAGYQESFTLTGSDTNGGKYTGTYLVKTESSTTFNGEQAIPVTGLLSLTNTTTKATITETGADYYSVDATDRILLGSENTTYGDTSTGSSLSALPQTAEIGNFGELGAYSWVMGLQIQITGD